MIWYETDGTIHSSGRTDGDGPCVDVVPTPDGGEASQRPAGARSKGAKQTGPASSPTHVRAPITATPRLAASICRPTCSSQYTLPVSLRRRRGPSALRHRLLDTSHVAAHDSTVLGYGLTHTHPCAVVPSTSIGDETLHGVPLCLRSAVCVRGSCQGSGAAGERAPAGNAVNDIRANQSPVAGRQAGGHT
jgi:hypothetical protein